MDKTHIETEISDPCVYLHSNSEQNRAMVNILSRNNFLENTYWLGFDGDDFVDNKNDQIIPYDEVKVYLDIDFQTPGHFDKVFIPITNLDKAKKVINEFSELFEQKKCFREFLSRI